MNIFIIIKISFIFHNINEFNSKFIKVSAYLLLFFLHMKYRPRKDYIILDTLLFLFSESGLLKLKLKEVLNFHFYYSAIVNLFKPGLKIYVYLDFFIS